MRIRTLTIALTTLALAAACDDEPEAEPEAEETTSVVEEETEQAAGAVEAQQPAAQAQSQRATMMDALDRAIAVMHPTEGNQVRGTVRFERAGTGVRVVADFSNLEPGSRHGFHIHEYGDCSAADGTSAGGHYAPEDHPHALPPGSPRHAGDLGNVEANDQGEVHMEETFDTFSIAGTENPAIGRGVILHAQEDTGQGESGEAGPRVACGVIGVAGPAGE